MTTYKCEYAEETGERLQCRKLNNLCIHQYYKICRGRYLLTEWSEMCTLREKEGEDGKKIYPDAD